MSSPFCYVVEPTSCPTATASIWFSGAMWVDCDAESPTTGSADLCLAETYVSLASDDAICQLWLDAGHNCDTSWDNVCANENPNGAEYNSSPLSDLDCGQCGGDNDDGGPSCPEVLCTLWCEHGYEVDGNGCQLCSCLDAASPPPAGSPSPAPPCGDIEPTSFCEVREYKCNQPWYQRNCALTCGQCDT